MEVRSLLPEAGYSKAFDSLNRGLFLERLREKMGDTEELHSWWDLFSDTEAGLAGRINNTNALWNPARICRVTSGICQRDGQSIYTHMGDRWSTLWLKRAWFYAGHRARAITWNPLDSYRNLTWWTEQQLLQAGHRHKGRFFPRLMNEERALDRASGGPWRTIAQDRLQWAEKCKKWVELQDLDWASMEQLSLVW